MNKVNSCSLKSRLHSPQVRVSPPTSELSEITHFMRELHCILALKHFNNIFRMVLSFSLCESNDALLLSDQADLSALQQTISFHTIYCENTRVRKIGQGGRVGDNILLQLQSCLYLGLLNSPLRPYSYKLNNPVPSLLVKQIYTGGQISQFFVKKWNSCILQVSIIQLDLGKIDIFPCRMDQIYRDTDASAD